MASYTQYQTSKGSFWQVRGYLGIDQSTGKSVKVKKRGFNTKKEAQAYYKQCFIEFETSSFKVALPKKIKFNQVYHEWLEIYKNDVEDSTYSKAKRQVELHILPTFGDCYIDKITANMIQKQLNQWHKEFKKFRLFYSYFKRIMKLAYSRGYVKELVTDKVVTPKKRLKYDCDKREEVPYYNIDELRQLMKILEAEESRKWHACIRTLAYTGLRRGEILALTWNDIDFTNKTLTVDKALGQRNGNELYLKGPKNDNSYRTISVDDTTLNVLKRWRAEQSQSLLKFGFKPLGKNQLVFNNTKSNSFLNLTAIYNAFKRICRQNNFRFIKPHGLRHTHCSLLFEAGVPMKDVMARLGHGDIQTTMNIYTHVTEQSEQKSAQLFAKYVNF
ncbi:tyrosine-type recombinase/integrase [Aerococcus sp. UMB1112A]|uniref:tyrosine-type recombinase/integrase n=1 Tax=Aerococcus sp. UMB1112A TaxID=3050609 RepID=UPI00254EB708|nr:tyrosine-type recombinase/integrase [Aerococcus sp. UMB1112A]MDK8502125.1 tyrosine-type recombinase/integrase [Aerococcus sp. UMB1112A]